MNWDALGAVAELIGAVGVIASLFYVASVDLESEAERDFVRVRDIHRNR